MAFYEYSLKYGNIEFPKFKDKKKQYKWGTGVKFKLNPLTNIFKRGP